MTKLLYWGINLQLFADGGDGGGDGSGAAQAATTGESSPAAGEARLRELGVPESVIAKRAARSAKRGNVTTAFAQPSAQPSADSDNRPPAPAEEQTNTTPEGTKTKQTWEEIMADPDYNQRMQETVQSRLKESKAAEDRLKALSPAIEVLCRKHGLDPNNYDPAALAQAVSDDDSYYEDKALELGVSVETAKHMDQTERELARRQQAEKQSIEQQRIQQHIDKLRQQGEALKQTFPKFDLATELRNPAFARMTAPNVGISVEDAYYAVHRQEIQTAAMQVTAQKTAQQMANNIRAGQQRPVENGTQSTAPSNTSFNYAKASKAEREAFKREIRLAAAQGRKIYPGQR